MKFYVETLKNALVKMENINIKIVNVGELINTEKCFEQHCYAELLDAIEDVHCETQMYSRINGKHDFATIINICLPKAGNQFCSDDIALVIVDPETFYIEDGAGRKELSRYFRDAIKAAAPNLSNKEKACFATLLKDYEKHGIDFPFLNCCEVQYDD